MEMRRYSPYGRLDPMLSGTNSPHVGQCRYEANCAMPAHSEVPDIVEEDHPCGGLWINGFTEERSDDDFPALHVRAYEKVLDLSYRALHPNARLLRRTVRPRTVTPKDVRLCAAAPAP